MKVSDMIVATRIALMLLVVQAATSFLHAAPRITTLSLRGLQIGGTTRMTVGGSGLTADTQVVLPFAGVSQKLVGNATPQSLQLDITLDAGIAPGIYLLRVANDQGISNAMAIGVDAIPQQEFGTPITSLPVALSGNLTGNGMLETSFVGNAGERVAIDVEALRLGSKLRPVVRLLDDRGTQLDWNSSSKRIGNDARIEYTIPAKGTYTLQLHDKLYRGAAPGFFRVKIGNLTFADLAFPFAIARDAATPIRLLNGDAAAAPLSVVMETLPASGVGVGTLQPPQLLTGVRPHVIVSDHAEVLEAEQAKRQPVNHPPIGINGVIAEHKETDTYVLAVKPGSKLRFDVLANRAGSPLDGVLTLRNLQNAQLAQNDDRPATSDPGLDFNVPANVDQIEVALRDLQGRGGKDFAYRILVSEINAPDFDLNVAASEVNIPVGGRQLLRVSAVRRGYNGAIQCQVHGLPEGVTVTGEGIAANKTEGFLTLQGPASTHAFISIVGTGEKGLVRMAQAPADPVNTQQPWLRSELAYAAGPASRIALEMEAVEGPFPQGARVPLKLKMQRGQGAKELVRLRFVSNQPPAKKTVKEKNKDVQKDAPEKMLRLRENSEVGSEVEEFTAELVIPVDLPAQDWEGIVLAELLSADKKQVLETSCSEPFRFQTSIPYTLALEGEPAIEARAGKGPTQTLRGKLVRNGDYPFPITVRLEGLPKEYPSPQVTLESGQSEFELEVRFPKAAAAAELKNVQLVAVAQPDPKVADRMVRSNQIALKLKVVAEVDPPKEGESPTEGESPAPE